LSVLNLNDISWSSRQVPVGAQAGGDPIEVATLTVETPIWVSPPVKVKHLGVITKIITGIYDKSATSGGYIDGLGFDPMQGTTTLTDLISTVVTTAIPYNILVYGNQAKLLGPTEPVRPHEPTLDVTLKIGPDINWQEMFSQHPGKYIAGSSKIYLTQSNGSQVVGTFAINPLDESILQINWNLDTLVTNTGIDSDGNLDTDTQNYSAASSYRPNSPGTFDAIINPQQTGPSDAKLLAQYGALTAGRRYLLIDDIGDTGNEDGADAWKSTNNLDLVARANDIIEWTGTEWQIIFNSSQETETMVWQTNIYTGVQYLWNGVSWVKSFEGEYTSDKWKIIL
jgi:hypothetical protein